jgi:hypothetical protein
MLDAGSEIDLYGIVTVSFGNISESIKHTGTAADLIPSPNSYHHRAALGRPLARAPSVPVYLTNLSLLI